MKINNLVFLIISVFIFSCNVNNNNQYADEIKQVDILMEELDECHILLKNINIDDVERKLLLLKSNLDTLEKIENISISDTKVISIYARQKKKLKYIKPSMDNLKGEVAYSLTQLKNLKHDLENNIVEDNKVKKYLADENKSINLLHKGIKNQEQLIKEQIPILDSLTIEINKIKNNYRQ